MLVDFQECFTIGTVAQATLSKAVHKNVSLFNLLGIFIVQK